MSSATDTENLTIRLSTSILEALHADADAQGKDAATVAAERLVALYADMEPEAIPFIA